MPWFQSEIAKRALSIASIFLLVLGKVSLDKISYRAVTFELSYANRVASSGVLTKLQTVSQIQCAHHCLLHLECGSFNKEKNGLGCELVQQISNEDLRFEDRFDWNYISRTTILSQGNLTCSSSLMFGGHCKQPETGVSAKVSDAADE